MSDFSSLDGSTDDASGDHQQTSMGAYPLRILSRSSTAPPLIGLL